MQVIPNTQSNLFVMIGKKGTDQRMWQHMTIGAWVINEGEHLEPMIVDNEWGGLVKVSSLVKTFSENNETPFDYIIVDRY